MWPLALPLTSQTPPCWIASSVRKRALDGASLCCARLIIQRAHACWPCRRPPLSDDPIHPLQQRCHPGQPAFDANAHSRHRAGSAAAQSGVSISCWPQQPQHACFGGTCWLAPLRAAPTPLPRLMQSRWALFVNHLAGGGGSAVPSSDKHGCGALQPFGHPLPERSQAGQLWA